MNNNLGLSGVRACEVGNGGSSYLDTHLGQSPKGSSLEPVGPNTDQPAPTQISSGKEAMAAPKNNSSRLTGRSTVPVASLGIAPGSKRSASCMSRSRSLARGLSLSDGLADVAQESADGNKRIRTSNQGEQQQKIESMRQGSVEEEKMDSATVEPISTAPAGPSQPLDPQAKKEYAQRLMLLKAQEHVQAFAEKRIGGLQCLMTEGAPMVLAHQGERGHLGLALHSALDELSLPPYSTMARFERAKLGAEVVGEVALAYRNVFNQQIQNLSGFEKAVKIIAWLPCRDQIQQECIRFLNSLDNHDVKLLDIHASDGAVTQQRNGFMEALNELYIFTPFSIFCDIKPDYPVLDNQVLAKLYERIASQLVAFAGLPDAARGRSVVPEFQEHQLAKRVEESVPLRQAVIQALRPDNGPTAEDSARVNDLLAKLKGNKSYRSQ